MTFHNLTNEEWFSLNASKLDSDAYNRFKGLLAELEEFKLTSGDNDLHIKELEAEIEELELDAYENRRTIVDLNTTVCELKKQLAELKEIK